MTEDAMSRRRAEPPPKNRTDFQLYVNWKVTKFPNIVDFTERRLLKLVRGTKDASLKSKLLELLTGYRQSKIAIAWQEGEPAWTSVQKD